MKERDWKTMVRVKLIRIADRALTFQTLIAASLLTFFGAATLIAIRPLDPKELTLTALLAVATLTIFAIATLVEHLSPTLLELRLRVRQLELDRQVDQASQEIATLRATIADLGQTPAIAAANTTRPNVYVLEDLEEPSGSPLPAALSTAQK